MAPTAACLLAGCTAVSATIIEAGDSLARVPIWSDAYWGTSLPIVRPGSSVFYVQRWWGATKGMEEVTRQSVFIRYDLATCHKTGEKTFGGTADAEIWGAAGQLWFNVASDRKRLHGFDGETLSVTDLAPPRTDTSRVPGPFRLEPRASAIRVWDLERKVVSDVPVTDGQGSLQTLDASPPGNIFVGVRWLSSSDGLKVSLFDRAGYSNVARKELTLPAAHPPHELRLLDGGTKLARWMNGDSRGQIFDVIETYALPGGEPLSHIELPVPSYAVAWSPSGRLVAYAAKADASAPFIQCGRELMVLDMSGKVVARRTFDTCVQPTHWSNDEMHLIVFHYAPPNNRSWSVSVAHGKVVELPAEVERSTPRAVEIAETLFYADGPSEAPHLAAVNLSTGQRWDVTKPLGHLDILAAEPQARKLIFTVNTNVVVVYDLAKATLTQCKL